MKSFWLAILTIFVIALSGCGGGGGSEGGTVVDPPIVDPPPPPPPVVLPLKVNGTAVFSATTVKPMIAIAWLNEDGNYIIIGKTVSVAAPDGVSEVKRAFSLEIPDTTTFGQIYLISYADINLDGNFQQSELIGECPYRLFCTGSRKWQVEDAFRIVPSWGKDATLCTGEQLLIELIL